MVELGFFEVILFAICMYGSVLLIAAITRSKSIFYFTVLCVTLRLVSFPLFYFAREEYTSAGWTAVREFGFEPYEFFEVIQTDVACLVLIIVAALVVLQAAKSSIVIYPKIIVRPPEIIMAGIRAGSDIMLMCFVIFLMVNFLIFNLTSNWKIGIPGVVPDSLPYRAAGILYWYQKAVGPAILSIIIIASRSRFVIASSTLLLPMVAFFTFSRSTVFAWAFPVAFVLLKSKNKLLWCIWGSLLIFSTVMAAAGRNLTVFQNVNALDIASSVTFLDVLEETYLLFQAGLPEIANGLVSRLGGAQGIVLGSQVEFPDLQFSLSVLGQIFTGHDFHVNQNRLVMLTHGFIPLDGTVTSIFYSGYMHAFLNSGGWASALFVLFSAVAIALNDGAFCLVRAFSGNVTLAKYACLLLTILFFGLLMVSLYWLLLIFICVVVILYRSLSVILNRR